MRPRPFFQRLPKQKKAIVKKREIKTNERCVSTKKTRRELGEMKSQRPLDVHWQQHLHVGRLLSVVSFGVIVAIQWSFRPTALFLAVLFLCEHLRSSPIQVSCI